MSSLSPLSNGSLKGKLVGVCVSGGLDSKSVCKRLVEGGIDVLAFSADLGKTAVPSGIMGAVCLTALP